LRGGGQGHAAHVAQRLEHVPVKHKATLILHLLADSNPIPMATLVGNNEASRISIPIASVHQLPDATAHEQQPSAQ
jgi:hypothetical protein